MNVRKPIFIITAISFGAAFLCGEPILLLAQGVPQTLQKTPLKPQLPSTKFVPHFTTRKSRSIVCSIISLIATPEKYNGKRVTILAYLNIYPRGGGAFFHKEDADNLLFTNALYVEAPNFVLREKSKYDGKYCIISGVFYNTQDGPARSYSGWLKDIDTVVFLSDPKSPIPKPNEKDELLD